MKNPRYFLINIYPTLTVSLLILITLICAPNQVKASESVVLKYGFLRESISVPELSTFANTGEMSSSLRAYLNLANQNPDLVRNVLTKEIPINGVLLSQILNSKPGEIFLDLVATYIQTPTGKASRESLRGAFITSALPDNNIRLIEILENYPTPEIHVEGDRLVELYTSIQKVIQQIPLI
jgi:hypothetical protein